MYTVVTHFLLGVHLMTAPAKSLVSVCEYAMTAASAELVLLKESVYATLFF